MTLNVLHLLSTRDGQMLSPRFDQYVNLSLEMYGEYSPEERIALSAFLKPGDTIVQVGANIGALTIPLARHVGRTGKVIAFEPQDMCYRALIANSALADQWQIEAVKFAVGAKHGVVSLPLLDYTQPGNFGGVSLATEPTPHQVAMTTLDIALKGIESCAVLHIDAEGAELDVLAGGSEFVSRTRPVMCVEVDRPHVQNGINAWMTANRYVGFVHRPPLFSKDNWRGIERNVFEDTQGTQIVSINCIMLPMERVEKLSALLPASVQGWPKEKAA